MSLFIHKFQRNQSSLIKIKKDNESSSVLQTLHEPLVLCGTRVRGVIFKINFIFFLF